MKKITLYKYTREDGGTSVSPTKPAGEYTEMVRLVADEDKMLTKDGVNLFYSKDTDTADGWYEVDAPEDDEEANDEDGI